MHLRSVNRAREKLLITIQTGVYRSNLLLLNEITSTSLRTSSKKLIAYYKFLNGRRYISSRSVEISI